MVVAVWLAAVPTAAQEAHEAGPTFVGCPTGPTVLGQLLQDLRAAAAVAEVERPEEQRVVLEARVVRALAAMGKEKCPRVLGVSMGPLGAPPAPGFSRGREAAYEIAADVWERYGYSLQDEDEASDALDREAGAADNVVARWSPQELGRIRAVLDAAGPWVRDLPVGPIVRDDVFRRRRNGGVESHSGVQGTYWSSDFAGGTVSPETRFYPGIWSRMGGSDAGCFEHEVLHELMHAFFARHHDLLADLGRELGWPRAEKVPVFPSYVDCSGDVHQAYEHVGDRTERYPEQLRYHQGNLHEDAADRATYLALGQLGGLIAQGECAKWQFRNRPVSDPAI